jgi:periplasmic protein TonB
VATEQRLPRIVDIVLGVQRPGRRHRFLIAAVIAAGAHASLWRCAQRSGASTGALSATVRPPPARDLSIDITPPPPPKQPPAPPKQPAPPPVRRPPPARARPAPAQAGTIIAQDPDPTTPPDLTVEPFVTGTANAYVGGATTSTGTSTRAVPATPDRSTPVSLEAQTWSCPWPREADLEQIDDQSVIIRVVVNPDGTAASVSVVSDPGHGFGQAATTCATQTRFTPARDREGTPIRATSPPIRVRFTR